MAGLGRTGLAGRGTLWFRKNLDHRHVRRSQKAQNFVFVHRRKKSRRSRKQGQNFGSFWNIQALKGQKVMEFNQEFHLDPAKENAQSGNEALKMPATKSSHGRTRPRGKFMVGQNVLCYYGPLLYLAKCIDRKKDISNRFVYLIQCSRKGK